jgi:hypothetical protein
LWSNLEDLIEKNLTIMKKNSNFTPDIGILFNVLGRGDGTYSERGS